MKFKVAHLSTLGEYLYVLFIYSREDTFLSWHLAPVSGSKSADHALFKMVRYVLLRPLRPELDAKIKTCLPANYVIFYNIKFVIIFFLKS
jgi:hypothetical protein